VLHPYLSPRHRCQKERERADRDSTESRICQCTSDNTHIRNSRCWNKVSVLASMGAVQLWSDHMSERFLQSSSASHRIGNRWELSQDWRFSSRYIHNSRCRNSYWRHLETHRGHTSSSVERQRGTTKAKYFWRKRRKPRWADGRKHRALNNFPTDTNFARACVCVYTDPVAETLAPVCPVITTKHRGIVTTSVAWVRERTIPTERPPLVGEISANVCGWGV
jgi:hypothetical protein